jgi:hypothetical protein
MRSDVGVMDQGSLIGEMIEARYDRAGFSFTLD